MESNKLGDFFEKIESTDFDERMEAVKELKEIGRIAVPMLIEIAGDNSQKVESRKSAIYALGQIGDARADDFLLKIVNGFWAGSADKRELARIKEKLSKDEHLGLAREAKAALVNLGYNLEMKTVE